MFIEASNRRVNDKARLLSPIYKGPTLPLCMKFWYNMYGTHIGTLNVYIMRQGVKGSPIWSKSGKIKPKCKLLVLYTLYVKLYESWK